MRGERNWRRKTTASDGGRPRGSTFGPNRRSRSATTAVRRLRSLVKRLRRTSSTARACGGSSLPETRTCTAFVRLRDRTGSPPTAAVATPRLHPSPRPLVPPGHRERCRHAKEERAHEPRRERAGEDPDLRLVEEPGRRGKCEPRDEEGDREADPRDDGHPEQLHGRGVPRYPADAGFHRAEREREDARLLAHEERDGGPYRDASGELGGIEGRH